MKGKLNTILLIVTLAVTVVLAGPASAKQGLAVDIGKIATLVEGGQAVELKIKTVCTVDGFEVLEAFVYVTQGGNQSQFAGIPVSCDSPQPQKTTIRVSALDFLFQEGEANASAFILLVDPISGETLSTSPTQVIQFR